MLTGQRIDVIGSRTEESRESHLWAQFGNSTEVKTRRRAAISIHNMFTNPRLTERTDEWSAPKGERS